jgi:biotin carboxyl carrier protein
MTKLIVNNTLEFIIELNGDSNKVIANGQSLDLDLAALNASNFHVLLNKQSFPVEVISTDPGGRSFVIKVNSTEYTVKAPDAFEDLLKNLGMQLAGQKKVNEVKAPMPGLILDIKVQAGQEIKKGDPLIVLEAMKMENILKAPADGVIQKIWAQKGDKVDKNAILFTLS